MNLHNFSGLRAVICFLLLPFALSCNKDDTGEVVTENASCTDPSAFIFNEEDGLVKVEFENAVFSGNWKLKSDGNSFSGKGYMVWQGEQHLHKPSEDLTTFKINIKNAGTYQFLWSSAVTIGTNGTDHNDTWLRFADAADFYAKKGNKIVYPKGSGKTPNPEGASADGWFKIYRGGNNLDFKWQSNTYDHDAHDVFVRFNNPGIYTMEISARSSGHAIDKFVLFTGMSVEEAIDNAQEMSKIDCQ